MACIKSSVSEGSCDSINKLQKKTQQKTITQIYTDWANHYLQKGRSKKHITDLQNDVTDGTVLADVIEAVTGHKVPDITKKPKGSAQMVDNISASLSFLASMGVSVEGFSARDIREGNLKAVLSLFFALSRYKQQQKQILQEKKELEKLREKKMESEGPMRLGKGPPPPHSNGGSAIPTPFLGGRKGVPDHHKGGRSNGHHSGLPQGVKSSSRSNSPAASRGSNSRSSGVPSQRPPIRGTQPPNGSVPPSPYSSKQKDSVLDKFKLFNSKEKESNRSKIGTQSKRTSSSSGFSSARSERSDSSISVTSDNLKQIPGNHSVPLSTLSSSSSDQTQAPVGHTPRGIRSRFSRSSKEGKESQRSARRTEDRDSSRGSPRSSSRKDKESRDRDGAKMSLDLNGSAVHCTGPLQEQNSKTSKLAVTKHSMAQSGIPSHQSQVGNTGPNTGIPKPMAAVKGTAKSNLVNQSAKEHPSKLGLKQPSSLKLKNGLANGDKGSDTSKEVKIPSTYQTKKSEEGVKPTVALVSPMPPRESNPPTKSSVVTSSESASTLSEMSQTSGNSSGSSVIYRPTSSEDDLDIKIPRVNNVTTESLEEVEDGTMLSSIKPMQPLIRPTQYMRGIASLHQHYNKIGLQDSTNTVPQKGMRPQHPRKSQIGGQPMPGIYHPILNHQSETIEITDIEPIEISNGYMSDGDILRPMHPNGGVVAGNGGSMAHPSELDGYLSEGGASLYAHRINQRFKEGMRQAQDSMNQVQHYLHDDSFDDSSSLSSGVSDSINEVCFGEDITHENEYKTGSVAPKDVGLKLPVGLSGNTRKVSSFGGEASRMHRNVSARATVKKTESAQQTEGNAFKQISNTQWKKYVDGNPQQQQQQRMGLDANSPNGRRLDQKKPVLGSPSIPNSPGFGYNTANGISNALQSKKPERKIGQVQNKVEYGKTTRLNPSPHVNGDSKRLQNPKTAPSNYGYNKRTSISSVSSSGSGKATTRLKDTGGSLDISHNMSSQSLERPRTKIKVSGGTQTAGGEVQYITPSAGVQSDGEYSSNSLGRKYQIKSYSLNGPAAAQLSQNVRERIMQSPYSKVHMGPEFSAPSPFNSPYYNRRVKPTDGSLSDSPYTNYSDMQYNTSPYMWSPRNNYASSAASAPNSHRVESMTEAESLESITSSNSLGLRAQHGGGLNSLTHARLLRHQREMTQQMSPPLARSNSVRSTKSEKLYSPTPQQMGGNGIPLDITGQAPHPDPYLIASQPTSPSHLSPMNRGVGYAPPNVHRGKEEDFHGSSISLVSTTSSMFSREEDKQAHEVRKLRRELAEAQDRVHTLATQLSTNAHVVAAFEHSLTNMTNRLQKLTATSERKDSELTELRRTIEALRQQSIDAGLTAACLQSGQLVRGHSVESVSSLSSACSGTSHTSGQERTDGGKGNSNKKKGWLRSSFTKAFSRGQKKGGQSPGSLVKEAGITSTAMHANGGISLGDMESRRESCSVPNSPMTFRNGANGRTGVNRESANSHEFADPEEVEMLEEQLREQDMALTDIRLEALTSAHQLESLKETINKMRSEMLSLKQDNDRLQKIVSTKSLTSSQSSLPQAETVEPRLSSLIDDTIALPDAGDLLLLHPLDKDGKKVNISVFLGCHGDYNKYLRPCDSITGTGECVIGAISISNKSKWDIVDGLVKRIFKEYLLRVDPTSGLGLSSESLVSYHLGEAVRGKDLDVPELLPCGYLVGEVQNIKIVLRGSVTNSVDALAFDTLIPKSIVQRYVSLLTEHRRIILSGPPGTGKTYLAQKLAEYLVSRMGREPTSENIATFNVDPKNSKDLLRSFLSNISEQCDSSENHLPLVIILDNLHHAGALTEVFNGILSAKYTQCPYIIGTMNQATSCSTTNLQLHHNFRWVLMANHMEPVKGVLSRVSRRRLTHAEVRIGNRLPRLQCVLDWVPKVWAHVNKFLETHSSSDVTLGPRLFLSCPGDVSESQEWFTELWNSILVPYMLEVVKEGLQLYGKRASWEDPKAWVLESYPWPEGLSNPADALTTLLSTDVGYELASGSAVTESKVSTKGKQDDDPLYNMLMRLQEAANYSSPTKETATPTGNVSLENIDSAFESTL